MASIPKVFLFLTLLCICVCAVSAQKGTEPAQLSFGSTMYLVSGAPTAIPIRLESAGGEREISFSVGWNMAGGMRYVRIDLAEGSPADTVLIVDSRKSAAGRVGITLTSATGFPPGAKILARLVGQGRSDDVDEVPLHMDYVDSPTPRRVVNDDGSLAAVSTERGSYGPGMADPGSLLFLGDFAASAGSTVSVPVRLGRVFGFYGLTNLSFSLQWDPEFVDYQSCQIGDVLPPGSVVTFDESMTSQGRLGVSIAGTSPFSDTVANYNLVKLSLRVRPSAPRNLYSLSFTDKPTPYRGSDANGGLAGASWVAGFINTGITYSFVQGTVVSPELLSIRNATVLLTDDIGFSKTVTTSSFGNFRFEKLPNLSNYTITVKSKRYRFAPAIVQPTGGLLPAIQIRGLE